MIGNTVMTDPRVVNSNSNLNLKNPNFNGKKMAVPFGGGIDNDIHDRKNQQDIKCDDSMGCKCQWALVPIISGREAAANSSSRFNDGKIVVLSSGTDKEQRSTFVGRAELLQALWNACGCLTNTTTKIHNGNFKSNSKSEKRNFLEKRNLTLCQDCQSVTKWAKLSLSRTLLCIQVTPAQNNQMPTITTAATKDKSISVDESGSFRNENCSTATSTLPLKINKLFNDNDNNNERGDGVISPASSCCGCCCCCCASQSRLCLYWNNASRYPCTLLRIYRARPQVTPLMHPNLQSTTKGARVGKHFFSKGEKVDAIKSFSSLDGGVLPSALGQTKVEWVGPIAWLGKGDVLSFLPPATEPSAGSALNFEVVVFDDDREGVGVDSCNAKNGHQCKHSASSTCHDDLKLDPNVGLGPSVFADTAVSSMASRDLATRKRLCIDPDSHRYLKRKQSEHFDTVAVRGINDDSDKFVSGMVIKSEQQPLQNVRLYFVPLGLDMSNAHLLGSSKLEGLYARARKRGATVLEHWDAAAAAAPATNDAMCTGTVLPTHIVVTDNHDHALSASVLAHELGFETPHDLAVAMGRHAIVCVKRRWVAKGNQSQHQNSSNKRKHDQSYPPFFRPTPMEEYLGIIPVKCVPVNDKHQDNFEPVMGDHAEEREVEPNSRRLEFSPSRRQKQSHLVDGNTSKSKSASTFPINQELSGLFRKLSKLYQLCPLEDIDEWRAYTFHIISGRLRRLPFDVETMSALDQLRAMKGFGASCIDIIKEYLQSPSHTCKRLEEFETNPQRRAMRQMMNIWGVGIKKARELVTRRNLFTVEEVREAIRTNQLQLERNQLIGLECYEDILEEMSREEVEAIFSIVSNAVRQRLPRAEMEIMGSYRRKSTSCGDVDILITHQDLRDYVQPRLLGKVVDQLCNDGYIAHHLTFISGMDPKRFETLPELARNNIINSNNFGRISAKDDRPSGSSYMGVFYSPFKAGRRRRVDIKFYPYRERIFATLYFTGNGHFNRSMRLWAARKKGWTLNDTGLCERDTDNRISDFEPMTERDVFDKLDLVYKEPHERDCFDAVERKDGAATDVVMSQQDLRKENMVHSWIK